MLTMESFSLARDAGGCPFVIQPGSDGWVPVFSSALGTIHNMLQHGKGNVIAYDALKRYMEMGMRLQLTLHDASPQLDELLVALGLKDTLQVQSVSNRGNVTSALMQLVLNQAPGCIVYWSMLGEAIVVLVHKDNIGYTMINPRTFKGVKGDNMLLMPNACQSLLHPGTTDTSCNVIYLSTRLPKEKDELEPDLNVMDNVDQGTSNVFDETLPNDNDDAVELDVTVFEEDVVPEAPLASDEPKVPPPKAPLAAADDVPKVEKVVVKKEKRASKGKSKVADATKAKASATKRKRASTTSKKATTATEKKRASKTRKASSSKKQK